MNTVKKSLQETHKTPPALQRKKLPARTIGTPDFCPIHINLDLLQSGKVLSLANFYRILFPQMSLNLLRNLLDLEQDTPGMVSGITPEEKEKLIEELRGITVEISYQIKDRGRKVLTVPINFSPSSILKNIEHTPDLAKRDEIYQKKIKSAILSYLQKELQNLLKERVEGYLSRISKTVKTPKLIRELLRTDTINKEGRLREGISVEKLLTGKDSALFKDLLEEEALKEAFIIKESIKALYEYNEPDYSTIINEAAVTKDLLDISIGFRVSSLEKETDHKHAAATDG